MNIEPKQPILSTHRHLSSTFHITPTSYNESHSTQNEPSPPHKKTHNISVHMISQQPETINDFEEMNNQEKEAMEKTYFDEPETDDDENKKDHMKMYAMHKLKVNKSIRKLKRIEDDIKKRREELLRN